jgi:formylglycine-generating enzyme required for sulfatase activity
MAQDPLGPSAGFDLAADLAGTFLEGRYRVSSLLGEGGMARVYEALDEKLARRVVLKVPRVELLASPEFRARFEREIKSLIGLDHPHVVKILDLGQHAGVPFAVLQYLGGGNLEDRLTARGPTMTAVDVARFVPDIARALDFIHARGFVHRDIKPANIMFDEAANPYVGDFGIARAVGDVDSGLTQTGLLVGSPRYMPPEAGLGLKAEPAYDQYSLAAVVYKALSGHLPHEAETAVAVLTRKLSEPPTPLHVRCPRLPPLAAAAVMRALSKEPAKRFPSCEAFSRAFVDALEPDAPAPTAAEIEDAETQTVRLPQRPAPRRRRWWPAAVALAAVVLGLAGFAAWWLRFRAVAPEVVAVADAAPAEPPTPPEPPRPQLEPEPTPPPPLVTEPAPSVPDDAVASADDPHPPSSLDEKIGSELILPEGSRDEVGPEVAGVEPAERAVVQVGVVELRATVTGDDLAAAEACGKPCTVTGRDVRCACTLAAGRQVVELVLRDAAGNETRLPRQLVVASRGLVPLGRNAQGFVRHERLRDGGRVVRIPASTFRMGSEVGAADEAPAHDVRLSAYLLDEHEVTWEQFGRFAKARNIPGPRASAREGAARHPVVNVTWDAAADYCAWVGGALPTEAQWEFGARGRDGRQYPWGDAWEPRRANWSGADDGFELAAPVGSFPSGASPFGVLDMAGNAAEWTSDWYGASSYADQAEAEDPLGPEDGDAKVVRGGHFGAREAANLRAARRSWLDPSSALPTCGFRCVMEPR